MLAFVFVVFETRSYYVAQAGLEFMILSHSSLCWDYRYAPPCPASEFYLEETANPK
jgi:hypothetical protein